MSQSSSDTVGLDDPGAPPGEVSHHAVNICQALPGSVQPTCAWHYVG